MDIEQIEESDKAHFEEFVTACGGRATPYESVAAGSKSPDFEVLFGSDILWAEVKSVLEDEHSSLEGAISGDVRERLLKANKTVELTISFDSQRLYDSGVLKQQSNRIAKLLARQILARWPLPEDRLTTLELGEPYGMARVDTVWYPPTPEHVFISVHGLKRKSCARRLRDRVKSGLKQCRHSEYPNRPAFIVLYIHDPWVDRRDVVHALTGSGEDARLYLNERRAVSFAAWDTKHAMISRNLATNSTLTGVLYMPWVAWNTPPEFWSNFGENLPTLYWSRHFFQTVPPEPPWFRHRDLDHQVVDPLLGDV